MADSAAFGSVCEELEQRCDLDRLESRGTVRLALQQAGLQPASVTSDQLVVVIDRILCGELTARGVGNAESVCAELVACMKSIPSEAKGQDPEAVFQRLGS